MLEKQQLSALLTDISLGDIRETLVAAADAAAAETLPLFRSAHAVENKLSIGFDPVTAADKNAERAVRRVIAASFPDHAIIGEEWEHKDTGSRFCWAIDPIDGTRAFITGAPVWGTLIGFSVDGHMVAGIMTQPFIGERFIGLPGEAVYERGAQHLVLQTSATTALKGAKLTTTSPDLFASPEDAELLRRFSEQTLTVRYGLDCYGYALLAAGQVDLVLEPRLNIFDIGALIPIIENAGGIVTTWEGNRADAGGNILAAANADLHAEALELIAGR